MKFARNGILLFLLVLGGISGAAGWAPLLPAHTPTPHARKVSLQTGELSVNPSTAIGSTPLATRASSEADLPNPGSALPLLSIIGFGVLMGGIFSARRTR